MFFLATVFLYLNNLGQSEFDTSGAANPEDIISTDRYALHVDYLAKDAMRGRGNGSPELELAADYLATQFRILGLSPAGEYGSYFQTLEITTDSEIGEANELILGGQSLIFNEDFRPMKFSSAGKISASLVFVGYGITAPEMHWDDYRGIDVTGKIVIAFRHEPQELNPESPFNGSKLTRHATFMNKTINAKQHGAKAIIFIDDPNNHSPNENTLETVTLRSEKNNSGIPAIYVNFKPILSYFQTTGHNLDAIQREMDAQFHPQSFELRGSEVRVVTSVTRVRSPVRNVIGAIHGSNPELDDEWIILGAHYDHLGLGGEYSLERSATGQVHNGADDNASGTAGILELARVISNNRKAMGRSILFMAFAGEELGLLGSNYFVNYPTIELEDAIAMLNFDMIGRMDNNRIFVGGVGTSPNFENELDRLNQTIGLNLDYSESGSGSSDHTSFNMNKIPVLFFFSGLHTDYHRPSDTSEKINTKGARNVLTLAYKMIHHLAGDVDRPLYTEVVENRPISGSGGGYGPYFGSIPDFRDDLDGVLFADVRSGSPADKAGFTTGDLLVKFGDQKIGNLYDFTYALRAHQPGDVVLVVVERNGTTINAEVLLESRQ